MFPNTAFVSSGSRGCKGELFDPNSPFPSTDDAVRAWRKYLRCKNSCSSQDPRLTINYQGPITDDLQLGLYDNIAFTKNTQLPEDVFLRVVIELGSGNRVPQFNNTQWDGPILVIDYRPESETNKLRQSVVVVPPPVVRTLVSLGESVVFRGINIFTTGTRIYGTGADTFMGPLPPASANFVQPNLSYSDSANNYDSRTNNNDYDSRDTSNSNYDSRNSSKSKTTNKYNGDKSKETSSRSNNLSCPSSPPPTDDLPAGGSGIDLPASGSCVPTGVAYLRSIVIAPNSYADFRGGIEVFAPNNNIIALTNLGVVSSRLGLMRAAALIVLDNFDRGTLNNDGFPAASMEVTNASNSALYVVSAGSVSVRNLRLDIFPGPSGGGTSAIQNPDLPNMQQGNRHNRCKDGCEYDTTEYNNALFLGRDCSDCTNSRKLKEFVIPVTIPATNGKAEVIESVFRNHNPNIPVFLSNFPNLISTYNDLINVKHFGVNHYSNNLGQIFSVDSDASLITNGSTFHLPRIIKDNYTHTRLDGTSFAIDLSDCGKRRSGDSDYKNNRNSDYKNNRHSDERDHHQSSSALSCSKPEKKESKKIFLPGDKAWNGRIIIYTRLDCNYDITAKVVTDGKLQGQCDKVLCIEPFQSFTLQNYMGDWRIIAKSRPSDS